MIGLKFWNTKIQYYNANWMNTMYQTNYVVIPKDYWTTTINGDGMLEYEEIAQLRIAMRTQDERIKYLDRIRLVAMQALEAIKESGVASIANQALNELEELKKRPNG